MRKKGNQHNRKPPTTMPKVLAAFFCLLNFAARPYAFAAVSLLPCSPAIVQFPSEPLAAVPTLLLLSEHPFEFKRSPPTLPVESCQQKKNKYNA